MPWEPRRVVLFFLTMYLSRRTVAHMIRSISQPELECLFTGTGAPDADLARYASKLCMLLDLLNAADTPDALRIPGLSLHRHGKGKAATYSVSIGPDAVLVFQFENGFSNLRLEAM